MFYFRESGREGEREGKKYQCDLLKCPKWGCAAQCPQPGVELETSWFAGWQPTEPRQPGKYFVSFKSTETLAWFLYSEKRGINPDYDSLPLLRLHKNPEPYLVLRKQRQSFECLVHCGRCWYSHAPSAQGALKVSCSVLWSHVLNKTVLWVCYWPWGFARDQKVNRLDLALLPNWPPNPFPTP